VSNEPQVETESDAPQGQSSERETLFASPFGVVAAVIALGVIVGAAVLFAVGSADTERAAFEPRPFEDQSSSQDAIAEWRSVIDSGEIAASLDDTELSWSELEGMLERLPAGSPVYTGVPNLETTRQVVRQWIITLALEDEIAARGIESVAADRQVALDETLLADPTFDETTPYGVLALDTRALTTTLDRAVDELALAAELEHPEYLCSSHILVETLAEAEETVALLDEGADFATLAIERSGDGSAAIGGDLGCGPTIGYVSEFSEGARQAGSGNISSPVRSQFGWHVISVRTIGELTQENHPEMTEAQIQQALGSFEPLARDRIANDLGTEIVDAAWERVATRHTLDERLGVWDSTVRFIAPPGAIDG